MLERRGLRLALPMALMVVLALAGTGVMAEVQEEGAAVPDFTLPTLEGTPHTLSERLEEGPVVLVFFRGVW
jgi:hypothetical protein